MAQSLWEKIVKRFSRNERFLKSLSGHVRKINALEKTMQALSDEQLCAKTAEFRQRLGQSDTLDSLLPEAFAVVREAAVRTLGQRHFDVQLKGGMVLHRGMIAEMKTGEGKTLTATLAVYLNALSGKGVHVVTVNDYLAKRDAEEMGRIYRFLGMTVGCIVHELSDYQRREAYAADITYGTNSEFGFDYLRDNMKMDFADMCQRPFNYAIVDEVDSILVDEARTPLIISGPTEETSDLYVQANKLIPLLAPEDYEKDEKHKSVSFSEQGGATIERLAKEAGLVKGDKLFDTANVMLVHHLNQALKAHKAFQKDVDYIVKDGEVIIVDEFTGRMMVGRRYSDGLHQALEAKEEVDIEVENQTLASITFQNYFLMYPKLAGMTGTAKTEEQEFETIYKLPVIVIPTHKPMIRVDMDDEIYRTLPEKSRAIVSLVRECRERGQPVLVGTISIEKSEYFSEIFEKEGIPHNVLNARNHEKEARIIAEAGVPGAVTIATNMAGRGTDIKLGGSFEFQLADALELIDDAEEREEKRPDLEKQIRQRIAELGRKAIDAGGLYIVGTERHESRRIDNQLRGRSGRQGDPGKSKFFICLHDDLMRIFGPNVLVMDRYLQKSGLQEDEPIIHPMITKMLEKAQHRVEAQHFDMRKHLLKYADVMNSQRKAVYEQRNELMRMNDAQKVLKMMVQETLSGLIDLYTNEKLLPDNWEVGKLRESLSRIFNVEVPLEKWFEEDNMTPEYLKDVLEEKVLSQLKAIETSVGGDSMRYMEKTLILRTLDTVWKEHINVLEYLRQGVHLQAYGQKDPLNMYKHEAFVLFKTMLAEWRERVLSFLCHFTPRDQSTSDDMAELLQDDDRDPEELLFLHPQPEEEPSDSSVRFSPTHSVHASEESSSASPASSSFSASIPPLRGLGEISRNALCPCGSGLRYKHCHGALLPSHSDGPSLPYTEEESIAVTKQQPDKKPVATKKQPDKEPIATKKQPDKKPIATKKQQPDKKPVATKTKQPDKKPIATKKQQPDKKPVATKTKQLDKEPVSVGLKKESHTEKGKITRSKPVKKSKHVGLSKKAKRERPPSVKNAPKKPLKG